MSSSSTRDELRQAYSDAWRKHLAGSPLTPLEAMLSDIIGLHPEYQALVRDGDAARAFEPGAAQVADNPFLHMGLHMAVREQVAIDLPPGVRDLHRRLQERFGDIHGAEHVLMEALAETLWEAQTAGRPADEGQYLSLARRRLAAGRGI
ncbi:MAG: hypothetical protein QOI88_959 [Gammaproteobacteria bacterium]|jgi:hypothetical protein|nr:hypothetical protein [Gammaproteobacteria bacterium]